MKRISSLTSLLLLTSTLLLTGCGKNDIVTESINTLTSNEFEGRLVGTEGNKKAETYLIDNLESLGIEKFNDSYIHTYKQEVYLWDNQQLTIDLKLNDKTKSLTYGNDFLVNSTKDIQGEYEFSTKPSEDSSKIYITDDSKLAYDENTGDIVILKDDNLHNSSLRGELGKTVIRVTNEIYDTLLTNPTQTISLDFKFKKSNIDANNVIGKISGESSKEAFVISAHFDHMGKIGKNIWRGALDNASGVSAALSIITELKETYKTTPPPFDIIFVFFNGEETNLQGSKSLVPELTSYYENLVNINIDCISMKESNNLTIGGPNEELRSHISGFFKSNNINVVEVDYSLGDGGNFNSESSPSISLSEDKFESIFHTLKDTKSNIDIAEIKIISNLLCKFITTEGEATLKSLADNTKKSSNMIEEIFPINIEKASNLKPLEFMYLNLTDGSTKATGNSLVQFKDSTKDVALSQTGESFMNILNPIFTLDKYKVQFLLNFDFNNPVSAPEVEKIYKLSPSMENLNRLDFQFFQDTDDSKLKCFKSTLHKYTKDNSTYSDVLNDTKLYFDYTGIVRPTGNIENIKVGDLDGIIIYGPDNKSPIIMLLFIEKDKNNYIINITDEPILASLFDSKETLLKLIEDTNVIEYITNYIDIIETNP